MLYQCVAGVDVDRTVLDSANLKLAGISPFVAFIFDSSSRCAARKQLSTAAMHFVFVHFAVVP